MKSEFQKRKDAVDALTHRIQKSGKNISYNSARRLAEKAEKIQAEKMRNQK